MLFMKSVNITELNVAFYETTARSLMRDIMLEVLNSVKQNTEYKLHVSFHIDVTCENYKSEKYLTCYINLNEEEIQCIWR